MNAKKMKRGFNNVAEQYDKQRGKFIPCYNDYYEMPISFLSTVIERPLSILDLGAGTGLLSQHFFAYYPDSKYTLIDISEGMLKVARQRFSDNQNFNFITEDYTRKLPDGNFDLICSALSIHHMEDSDKQLLYNLVFKKLTDKGCFINLDQFNPSSELINDQFNRFWYKQIQESNLPELEYRKWITRRELDKENTIDETRKMLTMAGFCDVECIYNYLKFGVVVGFKRSLNN